MFKRVSHILFLFSFLFSQTEYELWLKDQQTGLNAMAAAENDYMESVTQEFESYVTEQEQLFQSFRDEVEKKWDEFRFSSNKTYVDYDEDLNARGSINFEKGEVEIEVLVEDDPKQTDQHKETVANEKLQKKLAQVVTKEADDKQAVLKDQLKTNLGQKVTPGNANLFAKNAVDRQPVKMEKIKSKDGGKRIKYTIRIKMLPDHLETRAARYKDEVLKQSKRFEIDPAVAFAIMHTESSFNPMARSPVPAYGLMQLVPKSGARDAFNYIYKRDKLVTGLYLYVPKNNVELGCAYIRKLRYVYFKNIKDNTSAYYCTISAYNTGPGNVSKAFTGKMKITPAVQVVNRKSPPEVYEILVKKLPYKETRNYLKKVTSRMKDYSG